MSLFKVIPPLADRIRADAQAMDILRALADMTVNLEKAPKAYAVQQRIKQSDRSFAPSLYSVLNAGFVGRREPSGRMSLTPAGWEFLGEQPPFWINM